MPFPSMMVAYTEVEQAKRSQSKTVQDLKEKLRAKIIYEVRDIWPLSLIELAGVSSWNPLVLWMKQIDPMFGKEHSPDDFAGFLGIDAEDIDQRYPIQEVSTGASFFVVFASTSWDSFSWSMTDGRGRNWATSPLPRCP